MRSTILTIISALVVLTASAQQLTIEECTRLALENNKQHGQATLSLRQAEYTRLSTRAMFLPEFSLVGFGIYDTGKGALGMNLTGVKETLGEAVQQGVMADVLSMQQAQWISQASGQIPNRMNVVDYKLGGIFSGDLMLKQPLYMGGKIRAGYKMSQLAVSLYNQNLRKTDAEVILQTNEAYAKLVKAMELKVVAERYKELLQELDKNVESAIRHGLKIQNDRMKVMVKLNEVELSLRKAENGIRLALMNLCYIIGKPITGSLSVETRYPEEKEVSRENDILSRPEYSMLESKQQIAAQEVKMVRSEMLPQVALLAKYGYTSGVEVNNRKMLDDWNFAGGVTVNIPLYHFGEHTNKVKAAKAKLEQAQLEREDASDRMMLELTLAANNLDEAQLEVKLAESSLEQAQANMNLSRQQYDAGMETLSDCLEAQALWQQAYEAVVNARFQLYLSAINYKRAAGILVQ